MRRLYHFLGGIPFAITLIASTTLFVIVGTVLESLTGSHRYAAAFTFGSPLFTVLLALFFVNILVSALRRWPFQRRHIPFLMTHLGLLMLLAGAIGKQLYGLQGSISLLEGSGSQKVLLANSHAIEISSPKETVYWPIDAADSKVSPKLTLKVLEWRDNSREKLEFWIKDNQTFIRGLPPLPVASWSDGDALPAKAMTLNLEDKHYDLYTITTADIESLASKFALAHQPAIVLVGDPYDDNHLWIFDSNGQIGSETFRRESLETVVAYRDGFDGYAVESSIIPALECPITRLHTVQRPSKKLEDNLPLVLLHVADGGLEEKVPLTFDRYGIGMRWPALNGRYLFRFQPACCDIPYRLRLHHARQVSYPNSSQPYGYEARLTVTDRRSDAQEEVMLSMNHVHETTDGYRFYLAGITPPNETAVRQVQIVVNHDPFKYKLTYPGAIFLMMGIVSLFVLRPYRRKEGN